MLPRAVVSLKRGNSSSRAAGAPGPIAKGPFFFQVCWDYRGPSPAGQTLATLVAWDPQAPLQRSPGSPWEAHTDADGAVFNTPFKSIFLPFSSPVKILSILFPQGNEVLCPGGRQGVGGTSLQLRHGPESADVAAY